MIKFILKKFIIPILLAVAVFFIVEQNSFLYQEPVGQVIQVRSSEKARITDSFNNRDVNVQQVLEIKLLNTGKKGKVLEITNTVPQSQVTGQLYRSGQKLLLKASHDNTQFQIVGQKRDAVILALAVLFIGLLLSFVRWKASLLLLASLLLNLLYFIVALLFDIHLASSNVILIFSLLALAFAASSLYFVLGATRQMLYSLLTTVLTCLLTFGLTGIVLHLTCNAGVHFEYLNYVTQNPSQFFFVGAIISVLGAIMDGTGDIVAGLFGLKRQNDLNGQVMSQGQYFQSGINIGQEIVGTLTNILFMIFMAETIPLTVLLLRNGNSWSYIATVALNLGLLQTVISAIGIVLAVPVTALVVSLALARKEGLAHE
ncbi:YibE/F family protein [Lactococcus termiticola]|uniref:Membrane protein n=1 Tax=Lactococcus termiticola TaxID=2169526 RepID=A0A2R5HF95_9LACT|nr:YibE/F family protein [Lactococcus termiticola]GBG96712.1 membrane protein [Lactococcus termiticola]